MIASCAPRLTTTSAPRVNPSSTTIRAINFVLRLRDGNLISMACFGHPSVSNSPGRAAPVIEDANHRRDERASCDSSVAFSGWIYTGVAREGDYPAQVENQGQDHDQSHTMSEIAEVSDQHLDLRSEEIAQGHHDGNRNDRAEQVVEEKPPRCHAQRSGGNVDERAYAGE